MLHKKSKKSFVSARHRLLLKMRARPSSRNSRCE